MSTFPKYITRAEYDALPRLSLDDVKVGLVYASIPPDSDGTVGRVRQLSDALERADAFPRFHLTQGRDRRVLRYADGRQPYKHSCGNCVRFFQGEAPQTGAPQPKLQLCMHDKPLRLCDRCDPMQYMTAAEINAMCRGRNE